MSTNFGVKRLVSSLKFLNREAPLLSPSFQSGYVKSCRKKHDFYFHKNSVKLNKMLLPFLAGRCTAQ